MANTYPYISSQASLVKAVEQFRKSFPAVVDSALLKRLQIAPGNESYLINILRFLGLIDEGGAKVDSTADAFYGSEDHFRTGFTALVKNAYGPVFSELGADAWAADKEDLAHWFRMTDKTTELIGGRQAATFLTLAALTGQGAPLDTSKVASKVSRKAPSKTSERVPRGETTARQAGSGARSTGGATVVTAGRDSLPDPGVALSVKIEINVPAGATADEYDAMFSSIRKHLFPS